MAVANPISECENLADLLASFGGISPERVRLHPTPGTATKRDLIRYHNRGNHRYELVDGTLVEKPMGRPESFIAAGIIRILGNFIERANLGFCTGADDLIEVLPKLVRGPDVSFTSWLRRPEMTVDSDQISKVIPNLVVEVLSTKNTRAEIERKLREYFLGGVQVVWVIDPRKRTATIHNAADDRKAIDESGSLDGGDVLPGFSLPLAVLFERLEKPKPKPRKKGTS